MTLEQEKKSEEEDIAIKSVIQNRVEYFDILAKSKNITFDLHLQHATIFMERRKFIRIIDNLISNAIKYNKRGGKITIILQETMLSIIDTGIGIDQNKVPFMFDRYMRFNQSEGGFGVGLSIVKQIVDECGLKIEVDSEVGKGTTMKIRWDG
jgi:two-component system OmpR family sensor kinase